MVAIRLAVNVLVILGIDRDRRGFARVDHHVFAIGCTMQQEQAAAADARTLWFDYRERRSNRDRRVERIAAFGKHFETRRGGQGVRARDRRMAGLVRCLRAERS